MIVVKRIVAGLVGAMLGALIWFTMVFWMRPHADPNAEACTPDTMLECVDYTPAVPKAPAVETPSVACKGFLGSDTGSTAQLSECLHSAREAARAKELRRAQAVAGST